MFDITGKTVGMILGNLVAIAIGFVMEFIFMDLDYSRTERVQFEDDDYYYFVKAVPKKMVEYLLGEFDLYKIISIDSRKITQIQTYNLHGTLNQASRTIKPKIEVPVACLPTRIVSLDFKPESNNTVELYMDGGWQFNFRIHNASTKVETSLKFDIQIIGMPTTIISINCSWK